MKRKILGIALAMTFALTACGTEQDIDSSTPNSSVESMSSSVEETEKKLLTMEGLIELCNDAKWKDQVEEKGIEFFLQYSNLEQDPEKNSSTWIYLCDLDYNGKEYELQIYYYPEGTPESEGHIANEVDVILLRDTKTRDSQMVYNSESQEYVSTDITSFIQKEYSLEKDLEFEVPEGFSLGEYKMDMNNGYDGCLFVGDYQEKPHGESTAEANYVAGGIGVCDEEGILQFNGQDIQQVMFFVNHGGMVSEGVQLHNEDLSAIMYESEFETFTNTERYEYEQEHGVELSDEDVISYYWYVFMGKEGDTKSYLAFFNKDCFSREDVEQFVASVSVK